jgi:hypothetical protein
MTLDKVIASINAHQQRNDLHPLTCGKDSRHAPLLAKEQDGKVILVCPDCDYVQTWVPSYFTGASHE